MFKFLLVLCCLFLVTPAAEHLIDCEWTGITPISTYINVGDTVTWFGTNVSQSHWIARIFANFSTIWANSVPNSPLVFAPTPFSYSYTFTEADYAIEEQGFRWADALNPTSSVFGVVHIARPDDVILNFHEFDDPTNPADSNPPYAVETAIYPLNATIMVGQRVIFRDYDEPLIIHQISAGDGRNYRAACLTMPWEHTYQFTRRSLYWAWTFTKPAKYSWNCLVHPNEYGFIQVCEKHQVHGVWVPDLSKCGKWQRCDKSQKGQLTNQDLDDINPSEEEYGTTA